MHGISTQKIQMDFNIEDTMIISISQDDELNVRPAVLGNKLSLNRILVHNIFEFYTLVTLELT